MLTAKPLTKEERTVLAAATQHVALKGGTGRTDLTEALGEAMKAARPREPAPLPTT